MDSAVKPRYDKSMSDTITPSMRQYFTIKEQHPKALLFFRMGDFYELFFEDAVTAAAALDIALTKRGKHLGEDIPMCGVPVHAAEGYLARLTKTGLSIAICEQMESPAEAKTRGSKSVVHRDVVRLVTPGTLTEDTLLDARTANHLVAYAHGAESALARVDISTGEVAVAPTTPETLGADLARLSPSEILVSERAFEAWIADGTDTLAQIEEVARVTPLGTASFDSVSATGRLHDLYKVTSLEGFGTFSRAQLSALGALVDYIAITQKGALPHLRPPVSETADAVMQIDAATRRNLELTEKLDGGRGGSLLATIDRTVTGGGARLLAARLAAPLTDPARIARRLDAVALFETDAALTEDLRAMLKAAPDIARALSRLSLGRGGPRDLAALRDGLDAATAIATRLESLLDAPEAVAQAETALIGHDALIETLRAALVPEPPLLARDGNFVAENHDPDLDRTRSLRDDSRLVIRDLETRLKADTKITALKVKFNNVLGYFIEVPAAHGEALTRDEHFIHRQTMANAMRFTTTELADLDTRIAQAASQSLERELAIFEDLRAQALSHADAISETARALATLDVAAALGTLASTEGWTRPRVDTSDAFAITAGRHPVVEAALTKDAETFVANDCDLGTDRLWMLTGPNMAGKSTFLRQNALLAVLAQSGSYVPARAAHIGAIDRLFSRVGASDDLARGRSTFMVEMVETAAILNRSTPRSLVILDEIGRGTATFDGLSIAWAVLEHLHDVNRCRGLFATHYHELTELAARLDHARNAAMKVAEWEGDIVFLHEVEPGAATRSYGVQVARKAGLPPAVIERARDVLQRLEKGDAKGGEARIRAIVDDLPLFAALKPAAETTPSPLIDALEAIDPDALTPREAHEALYRLKTLLDG